MLDITNDEEWPQLGRILLRQPTVVEPRDRDGGVLGKETHRCRFGQQFLGREIYHTEAGDSEEDVFTVIQERHPVQLIVGATHDSRLYLTWLCHDILN